MAASSPRRPPPRPTSSPARFQRTPRHRHAPQTPTRKRAAALDNSSLSSPLIQQILSPREQPHSAQPLTARSPWNSSSSPQKSLHTANPPSAPLLLTANVTSRPSSALQLRTTIIAKEAQTKDLYPARRVLDRSDPSIFDDDPPWQPTRIWNSPLQHMEDTAAYDRRYVGRLVAPPPQKYAPPPWSPKLDLAMTRGGGHVSGWPHQPWRPSPRATPELRARLAAEAREAAAPPISSAEIAAKMNAQAAQWEAEAQLKAIRDQGQQAKQAQEAAEAAHDEWWEHYERRREDTLRASKAAREAELEAMDAESERREREEREATEALKAELEQRRKKRLIEAARVEEMMAAQKAEMDEMRKAAAKERLAKERQKAEKAEIMSKMSKGSRAGAA